ncbi:hypothetical protein ACP70R_029364 [Stipagrostis hirtigluma subsp. patula]
MVGGSLYWLLGWGTVGILELDLDRHCLDLIHMPVAVNITSASYLRLWVMPDEGGGLGFLHLSGLRAQLWTRKTDCDGAAQWVLRRTIELGKVLPLRPPMILGFDEEDKVSLLATGIDICMVQLESMQLKKSFKISTFDLYHPFASVYTAGLGIGGGQVGAEVLHNNLR